MHETDYPIKVYFAIGGIEGTWLMSAHEACYARELFYSASPMLPFQQLDKMHETDSQVVIGVIFDPIKHICGTSVAAKGTRSSLLYRHGVRWGAWRK